MKPVSLNQLLFHPRGDSVSFFLPPDSQDWETLFDTLCSELAARNNDSLLELLSKNKSGIKRIIKSHPKKAHGFFFAHLIQGYVILDNETEGFYSISDHFHIRPLVEDLFSNPEFMVVNVSLYDVKIYRGDFEHLEIIQQFEFSELPSNFFDQSTSRLFAPKYMGLIPYKNILALKTIALKLQDLITYHSLPVIVTGLDEVKALFLRYLGSTPGLIPLSEDFFEKSCSEILEKSLEMKGQILDFYSELFKERLRRMMNSKRILSDLKDIIRATAEGRVIHLVLPMGKKLWGSLDFASGEFDIHEAKQKDHSVDILNELADEMLKQGARIQFLRPQFFPPDTHVLAIVKGVA